MLKKSNSRSIGIWWCNSAIIDYLNYAINRSIKQYHPNPQSVLLSVACIEDKLQLTIASFKSSQ